MGSRHARIPAARNGGDFVYRPVSAPRFQAIAATSPEVGSSLRRFLRITGRIERVFTIKGSIEAACHPSASVMSAITKSMLLDSLDEAFDKKSWHSPNLRNAIGGVRAVQAAWRPAEDRHDIWELTLHAAYWKYVARPKILREKRGSFVPKGSNYFLRPERGTACRSSPRSGSVEARHRDPGSGTPKAARYRCSFAGSRSYSGGAAFDPRRSGSRSLPRGTDWLLRRMCS